MTLLFNFQQDEQEQEQEETNNSLRNDKLSGLEEQELDEGRIVQTTQLIHDAPSWSCVTCIQSALIGAVGHWRSVLARIQART